MREAWEEAGIVVDIEYDLGEIEEMRAPKSSKDRSCYHFFQGVLVTQYTEWPEQHKRERDWFTYQAAMEELSSRPELQEAINRSTIIKN